MPLLHAGSAAARSSKPFVQCSHPRAVCPGLHAPVILVDVRANLFNERYKCAWKACEFRRGQRASVILHYIKYQCVPLVYAYVVRSWTTLLPPLSCSTDLKPFVCQFQSVGEPPCNFACRRPGGIYNHLKTSHGIGQGAYVASDFVSKFYDFAMDTFATSHLTQTPKQRDPSDDDVDELDPDSDDGDGPLAPTLLEIMEERLGTPPTSTSSDLFPPRPPSTPKPVYLSDGDEEPLGSRWTPLGFEESPEPMSVLERTIDSGGRCRLPLQIHQAGGEHAPALSRSYRGY